MTKAKFNKLKIGDTVTISENLKEYGYYQETWDNRVYIPKGTQGIVGAVKVPSVLHSSKGVYFVCVDFPVDTPLVDSKNLPVSYENIHKDRFRVAAWPCELE